TLYHKEDLPIPIRDVPNSFAAFKKKVEKESFVRPVLPPVTQITTHPHLESTHIPTLEEVGFSPEVIASVGDLNELPKGEEKQEQQTSGGTLFADYNEIDICSLDSPYIAIGTGAHACQLHKVKEPRRPSKKKKDDPVLMRLLWQDYFRFMLEKPAN